MKRMMKGMLAAVIAAALVFGMVSCGGGGSPTAAAKAFVAAAEKGDSKAMEKVATPETVALMAAFSEKLKPTLAEYGKITNSTEKIDGDTAKVTLTFENGETADIDLVKEKGKWLVASNK